MRRRLAFFLAVAGIVLLAGPASSGGLMTCRLKYDLKGWSVIYRTAKGTGKITCENGQSTKVRISTYGGGATLGTTEVIGGKGRFSGAKDIGELYGTYIEVAAHAGAGASTDARAMTRGDISLSLAGTGRGLNLGVALGGFIIKPL